MIADTHSHLNWESYKKDLNNVLIKAKEKNVGLIINVGVDYTTSKKVIEQSKTITQIPTFATIGIHPHEASNYMSNNAITKGINDLESLFHTHSQKIVAIGECGLDYNFLPNLSFIPSEVSYKELIKHQKTLFSSQVRLAQRLDLPLVIHCRNPKPEEKLPLAWKDIFITELNKTKGVFHNFSSTLEDAKKALDLGFYLSFSCVITYPKNDHLRAIITKIPLERVVTETDCPFLPPQPIRGHRNEPFYVSEVIRVISEIKGIDFDQVANQTYINAKKLFIDKHR